MGIAYEHFSESLMSILELPMSKSFMRKEHLMKNILNEVLTVSEVADKFGINTRSVRVACQKGWMPEGTYRRTDKGSYIILKSAADEHWGRTSEN